MGYIKELMEFWKENIHPNRYKTIGLLLMIGFAIVSGFGLTKVLKELIYLINEHNQFEISLTLSILFTGIAIIYWSTIRKLPVFAMDEIGILVATTVDGKVADEELVKLTEKLSYIIENGFSESVIRVTRLTPNHLPKTEAEAHKIRKECHAQVIIWGRLESAKFMNQSSIAFLPINFSCNRIHSEILDKNINKLLSKKQWLMSEANQLIEREFLARNMEEIISIILGLALFSKGRINEADTILRKLYQKLSNTVDRNQEENVIFAHIRTVLYTIHDQKVRNFMLQPQDRNNFERLEKAKILFNDLSGYDNQFLLMFSAQIKQLEGDSSGAMEDIKKVTSIAEVSNAAPNYSLAYLYFYNGRYHAGFNQLRKIVGKKKRHEKEQLPSIMGWWEQTLQLEPSKKYLNFAIGFLYFYEVGDKELATQNFQIFIAQYSNSDNAAILKMVDFARKRL